MRKRPNQVLGVFSIGQFKNCSIFRRVMRYCLWKNWGLSPEYESCHRVEDANCIRLHIIRSEKMCMRVPIFLFLEEFAMINKVTGYFSRTERMLWTASVLLIVLSFCVFDRENYLTLLASLVGVTSLILNAKGNPAGQLLMVLFSLLYGVISYTFSYYGEMMTYLGMTMPMSVFALVSWLRNPYAGNRSEVRVNRIHRAEWIGMWIAAALVTALFYWILKELRTTNLLPSTVSVTTSFLAVYLSFRRSPEFALAYAANDLVLICLWMLASLEDRCYLAVTVCFLAFFVNDLYGFVSWKRMERRQNPNSCVKKENAVGIEAER